MADSLSIDSTLIGRKKIIEKQIAAVIEGDIETLVEPLSGWRRTLIGEPILEIFKEHQEEIVQLRLQRASV